MRTYHDPGRGLSRGHAALVLLLTALCAGGCASSPYVVASSEHREQKLTREGEPRFTRGNPHAFLDGVGHYFVSVFLIPSKLILLDWGADNHNVSEETEQALRDYLDRNNLCDVKVLINDYDVPSQWRRLFKNREIGGFWRYTFGILSAAAYTILPGRFFGGDAYNPFTNTIYIYSDVVPVVLHEGGHAKDFARRDWKGLYAAMRLIPFFPLYQEGIASNDALSYARGTDDFELEKRATPMLWGALGTYVGGEALSLATDTQWWFNYALIPVAWAGHLAGWTRVQFQSTPPPLPEDYEDAFGNCDEPEPEWEHLLELERELERTRERERDLEIELERERERAQEQEEIRKLERRLEIERDRTQEIERELEEERQSRPESPEPERELEIEPESL